MKGLKQFIKTTLREFLNENNTHTRNGYQYTKIYSDGNFDYYLVQKSGNTIGIEVYLTYNRKLIGSISIGVLDDEWLNDYSDDEYYKIINKNPFIHNVSVIEEFQNKGIATKLYELLFKYLKKDGYNIVYSGNTRNSMFVDNLWKRFGDGFETINDDTFGGEKKIYYKNL